MLIRRTDTVQNTEKNLGEKQQGSLCNENSTVKQGDKNSKHCTPGNVVSECKIGERIAQK